MIGRTWKNRKRYFRHGDKTRLCRRCHRRKHLSQFYRHQQLRHLFQSNCKSCCTVLKTIAWRRRSLIDKVRLQRKHRLWRMYRITPEQYNGLLIRQNKRCGICRTKSPRGKPNGIGIILFHVDHCHKTGKIRGLLCHHCNLGIGYFREKPRIFSAAAKYLRHS